jgi:hypothetical protein
VSVRLVYLDRAVLCGAFFIEYTWTRDRAVDLEDGSWITLAMPPPGNGWHVCDATSRDRRTRWRRFHLIERGAS